MSGGKTISFLAKAKEHPEFFFLGENNAWGFNNQAFVFAVFAVVGVVLLAKTTAGYQTFATGGNELASGYAGIPTHWVRIRAYLMSAFCATVAGMMQVAQDRALIAQSGQGLELIVIAAVIVGGASILGGRGRVLGSMLGVILIVLVDKVLREGYPTTRIVLVDDIEMKVQAVAQLPPGAVPAFLGLILILAVLIEPWLIRRNALGRLWAWLRGLPIPPAPDTGGVAIVGAQTRGSAVSDRALHARGLGRFLARRDAAAIMIAVALWFAGLYLRPDFWGGLDNSFNLVLAFTEVALLAIGLTFRDRQRRHRPLGRLGACHERRHRGFLDEDDGPRPVDGDPSRPVRRHARGRGQRARHRPLRAARVRRHARHVLYRPRHRGLDRLRPRALRLSGKLQSDRPQADRSLAVFRRRARHPARSFSI